MAAENQRQLRPASVRYQQQGDRPSGDPLSRGSGLRPPGSPHSLSSRLFPVSPREDGRVSRKTLAGWSARPRGRASFFLLVVLFSLFGLCGLAPAQVTITARNNLDLIAPPTPARWAIDTELIWNGDRVEIQGTGFTSGSTTPYIRCEGNIYYYPLEPATDSRFVSRAVDRENCSLDSGPHSAPIRMPGWNAEIFKYAGGVPIGNMIPGQVVQTWARPGRYPSTIDIDRVIAGTALPNQTSVGYTRITSRRLDFVAPNPVPPNTSINGVYLVRTNGTSFPITQSLTVIPASICSLTILSPGTGPYAPSEVLTLSVDSPNSVGWSVQVVGGGPAEPISGTTLSLASYAGQDIILQATGPDGSGQTCQSDPLQVTVSPPCSIQWAGTPPSVIEYNESATFSVQVVSGDSSQVEWFIDGAPAGTGPSLTVQGANYPGQSVLVSAAIAGCGSVNTPLQIGPPPPCSIQVTSPSGVVTDLGTPLLATASGGGAVSTRFLSNGQPISDLLGLPDGAYSFTAEALDGAGSPVPGCSANVSVEIVVDQPSNQPTPPPGSGGPDEPPVDADPPTPVPEPPPQIPPSECPGDCPKKDDPPVLQFCMFPNASGSQFSLKGAISNPVHLATGRKLFRVTDFSFATPGQLPFSSTRFYESSDGRAPLDGVNYLFGNWRGRWDFRVRKVGSDWIEERSDATAQVFPGDGSGGFLSSERTGSTIQEGPEVVVTALSGIQRRYDGLTGRLSSMADRHGNTFTLTYTPAGFLQTITGPVGRVVQVGTDAAGRITSMTIPGDPARSTWTFAYTSEGFLSSVTDPLGSTTSYAYDASGHVLSRTSPTGFVRSWIYDTEGRVIQLTNESGDISTFAYGQGIRTYTNAEGETWTFHLNDQGRITRTVAPDASQKEFHWSPEGLMLSFDDELGRSTSYEYDGLLVVGSTSNTGLEVDLARDPVTKQALIRSEPDGSLTTSTVDVSGNLLTRTNSEGEQESWTYNARGQVLTFTSADGEVTQHVYDGLGNRIQTIAPDGTSTSFEYDALSRVTAVIDALGRRRETEYLLHNIVSATVDSAGGRRETEYDALYRPITQREVDGDETHMTYRTINSSVVVTSTTDPLGNTTTYEYDKAGRRTAVVAPNGARTETVYDDRGRVVQITDALGGVTQTVYNLDGTVQKTIDALGHETTFTYDGEGRQVQVTDALGGVIQTVYNSRGFVVKTIAPDGAETTFEHDSLGRVSKTIDALGGETQSLYDEDGRLASTVDALGNTTTYEYDAQGRQTKVTDALGAVTQTVYDSAGQVVKTIDPMGGETLFEYDALGRQTKVTDPLGNETLTAYNLDGTVQSITNARGFMRTFGYDALGRVTQANDPLGYTIQTEFDAVGNRTKLTDEAGNQTTFAYDLLGRITSVTDAAGNTVTSEYDAGGRRTKTTNARGQEILYGYDSLGRLTSKTLPEGTETYAYDGAGRRILAMNDHVTEFFSYDLLGRMHQKTDSRGFSMARTFDSVGNVTSTSDTHGNVVTQSYDARNQLVSLVDYRGGSYAYTYSPAGQLSELQRPNGVVTTWSYDSGGRVTSVEHATATTPVVTFAYTYDPGGNRVTETETLPGQSPVTIGYSYDARDQLTAANISSGDGPTLRGYSSITYSYDPVGNRTQRIQDGVVESYTYNNLNQLTARDGLSFGYDLDGNMTSEALTANKTRLYNYDSEGNLIGVDLMKPAAQREWSYDFLYDPDNRKISVNKEIDEAGQLVRTRMEDRFWVGGSLLEDRRVIDDVDELPDPNHTRYRRFLRGPGGVLGELRSRLKDGVFQEKPNQDRIYLQDALGSTIASHQNDGTPWERIAYLPFGEQAEETGEQKKTTFTYTGLLRERIPGGRDQLYSAAFRHLRPALGRWLKRDPAGDVDGPNLYRYVMNRPTALVDPSGAFSVTGSQALGLLALLGVAVDVATATIINPLRSDVEYWQPALDLAATPPFSLEPKIARVRSLNLVKPCNSLTLEAFGLNYYYGARAVTIDSSLLGQHTFRGANSEPANDNEASIRQSLQTLTHESFHAFDSITPESRATEEAYLLWRRFYDTNRSRYSLEKLRSLWTDFEAANGGRLAAQQLLSNKGLRRHTPTEPDPRVSSGSGP